MSSQKNILVIFGVTGDLSHRKLLPALHHITKEGFLGNTTILGISRQVVTAKNVLEGFPQDEAWDELNKRLHVLTMDVTNQDDYTVLREKIHELLGVDDGNILFYLSVPPQAFLPIVERLGTARLNGDNVKLLIEKPFGTDLDSAKAAVGAIERYFDEQQLYRIDHYLAKEMAQNIIAFRSHNAIFRSLWSKEFIEKIDIIASEKIGIENRATFYEQTGAIRDVVQNHLLQLLALVLMELPHDLKLQDIPAYRLKALEAIQPVVAEGDSFRAQYDGYRKEVDNHDSITETFAAVRLFSSDPTWRGVPMRLATGKNLAVHTTEIRVYFKQAHPAESNLLVFHIQPKEGIEIDLVAKKQGYDKDYEKVALSFDYRAQEGRPVEAYERVLVDALTSDKSLFTTTGEVIRSWELLQAVQRRWAESGEIVTYVPGSSLESLLDRM